MIAEMGADSEVFPLRDDMLFSLAFLAARIRNDGIRSPNRIRRAAPCIATSGHRGDVWDGVLGSAKRLMKWCHSGGGGLR
jgi:hypothetical protein